LSDSLEKSLQKKGKKYDWRIRNSDLEYIKILGKGNAGKVWKGLWLEREVAIKVLKNNDPAYVEDFKKEFLTMSAVVSKRIVKIFGACLEPKICMVMEFCERGSLYDILKDEKIKLCWDHIFKFAIEIADGINCLHTWIPKIYHRDLKSLNILVSKSWDVKIADFGLARFDTNTNATTMETFVGTIGWNAPELFGGKKYSASSDVYSIAIIFWEMVVRIITGKYLRPYGDEAYTGIQLMLLTAEKRD